MLRKKATASPAPRSSTSRDWLDRGVHSAPRSFILSKKLFKQIKNTPETGSAFQILLIYRN